MLTTRRDFGRLGALGFLSVGGVQTGFSEPAKAGPHTPVRLSANENPYGPSPLALDAMRDAMKLAWRYPDEAADALVESIARLHSVSTDQVILGDGSSEILKLVAAAYTSPSRSVVVAEPTFEAIAHYATASGAGVVKVPLDAAYAHDIGKMAPAGAGVVYICNPNNPTASITPKDELRDLIATSPPQTTILVDEAYFHYADSPDYDSVIALVKDHPNLIVSRTFSKIYGMAGLRCGYCVAQKETIDRLRRNQMWDSVNCMALAAATASLDDLDHVPNGQRLNREAKTFVTSELDKMGYKQIPSQANFIMFDCKRPVTPLIQAMKQRKVHVGRLFPTLPNYMRLTIGKKTEMESFVSAFKQVTA